MAHTNSENPYVGRIFQGKVQAKYKHFLKSLQGSCSVFFSILPGRAAINVLEGFSKVAVGDKAALFCDHGNDPKSVPIVGIDATEDAREEIRSGNMAMTVFQSAKGQAGDSVQAAINMLDGKDLADGTGCEVSADNPYTLYFPFIPVAAENVDDI